MRVTTYFQRRHLAWLTGAALLALMACGEDEPQPRTPVDQTDPDPDPDPDPVTQDVFTLSATDHLVRASMALRGLRPSEADMDAVAADPDALPGIIDRYLQEDSFGETLRDMHDEVFQVRPFFFWFPPRGEFAETHQAAFNDSAAESPLRLIEHVVMNDRPYSEIVTANYTVADRIVAYIWGMEYDGDGQEWVETRWPEPGREHAGLLTDSRVWMRHYSTPLNANRSRANLVSKAFLCFDFLDNDINVSGNIDLTDPEALKNTVRRPECASCHQSLDPLAAAFWEFEFFTAPGTIPAYPYSHFKPEYKTYRPYFTDRDPGYFGKPMNSMAMLGRHIAQDPRFSACAVRRFYSWLHQVPMDEVPQAELADLQRDFLASNMNARQLARQIVLAESFRFSHTTRDDAPESFARLQKVRPRQLSRMMEDLIGFRWTITFPFPLEFLGASSDYGEVDLLGDHLLGYEVLGGGIDDFIVTQPVHTLNPTSSLVFDNLAREAAAFVVQRDLVQGAPAQDRLLLVDPDEADPDAIRAELARLHKRLFAEVVDPDDETVELSYALFSDALARSNDPRRAWAVVLTAFLQDSRLLYY
jgi:hypothetical protein